MSSPSALLLPCCITDLAGIRTYGSFARLDVTCASSEFEDVESVFSDSFWKSYRGWIGDCTLLGS